MTPARYYQRLIESEHILPDEQQGRVIDHLQAIFDRLTTLAKSNLFNKLMHKQSALTQGIYLWGEVGIGKTFLIDCFFYCLPFKNKLRIHFHKFMKMLQEQLTLLQGVDHPLEKIAKKLAKQTCVICFDELVVNDIADAMLLAGLFDQLYKQNICLTFTSNTAPDNLYLKGIQRDSFLPAIALIKQHSNVINITSHCDYRLRNYKENNFYYSPLSQEVEEKLQAEFTAHSQHAPENLQPLTIYGRDIRVRKRSDRVIWFDFLDICGSPRSQNDYLAIASQYCIIIVSNVTPINANQHDLARSFINLVDVLYDAQKQLIISAEAPPDQLYLCGRMLFEFSRTRSRLLEMQTLAWQNKCEAAADAL